MKKLILLFVTVTQLAGAIAAHERGITSNTDPAVLSTANNPFPYNQDEPRAHEQLYTNFQISVSSIFPNPASSSAYVEYKFHGDIREAKIVLCNVLGNVVGEYRLSKEAKRLNIATQELSSGVYFYTLSLDGRNVVTKKLIIRHSS